MKRMVKVYGKFCVPCKIMAPIWKEFTEMSKGLGVTFEEKCSDDFDDSKWATEHGVLAVPTFLALDGAAVVGKISGIVKREQLNKLLQDLKATSDARVGE